NSHGPSDVLRVQEPSLQGLRQVPVPLAAQSRDGPVGAVAALPRTAGHRLRRGRLSELPGDGDAAVRRALPDDAEPYEAVSARDLPRRRRPAGPRAAGPPAQELPRPA